MDVYSFYNYIFRLHKLFSKKMKSLYETYNLSHLEFLILMYIYYSKETVNTSQLALEYEVTLPAIMHQISNLEGNGYLTRKSLETDHRTKLFILLPKGIEICKKLEEVIKSKTNEFLDTFNNKSQILEDILKDTLNYMEEM